MPAQQPPDFYDVFISYRHRDEAAVRELEAKIRGLGFEPFLDFNFPSLADAGDVTPEKVEAVRQAIARATCLIDAILASAHSQRQLATRGLVQAASVVARPKLAQSGEPEPAKAWGDLVTSSLQPLGWPPSLTSQSRPWAPPTTERGNIEGLVT